MTSVKITDLTAYTDAASTDVLPIVDVGADVTKKIAIGDIVKAVPQGTAALPGLAFDGDPNSGLFSAGADQVAISTNGTGRLFVDANGNVGVGATPTNYANYNNLVQNAPSGATLEQRISGTLRGSLSTDSQLTLKSVTLIPLVFGVGNTEVMRLDTSGRLGLGTSSPAANLDVRGVSGTTIIRAAGADINGNADVEIFSTGTTGSSRLYFSDTAAQSGSIIYTHSTNSLSFTTNATTAVTIDSSQRVGIGTTSPSTLLHLSQSSSGAAVVSRIENTNTAADSDAALDLKTPNAVYTLKAKRSGTRCDFEVDGSPKLSIDTSGNVGIGTTTASNLLHLRSDSSSNVDHLYIQNRNGGANSGARIAFSTGTVDYGDNRYAYIGAINTGASESGNHLVFATNANGASPSEKVRITSDGKLGLGTSAPAATLHSRSDNAGSESTPLLIQNRSISANTAVGISFAPNISDTADRSAIIYGVNSSGGSGNATDLTFHTNANGASPSEAMRIKNTRVINFSNAPVYADNAAAKTGGLVDGDVYRTSTGDLKIVYT